MPKRAGSPTESARERARARRRYPPKHEYDPKDSRAVRGFDSDSLLSARSRQHSETRGSNELTFQVERRGNAVVVHGDVSEDCLLYTSPSPRDGLLSRMPSSA